MVLLSLWNRRQGRLHQTIEMHRRCLKTLACFSWANPSASLEAHSVPTTANCWWMEILRASTRASKAGGVIAPERFQWGGGSGILAERLLPELGSGDVYVHKALIRQRDILKIAAWRWSLDFWRAAFLEAKPNGFGFVVLAWNTKMCSYSKSRRRTHFKI